MRWHKIADETGERRGVAKPRDASELPPAERRYVEQARHPRWLRWLGVAAVVGFAGFLASAVVQGLGVFVVPAWIRLCLGLMGFVGMLTISVMLPLRELLGFHSRAMGWAWKQLGRCPWCAYPAQAADPTDDGLWRCPECGGRWRIRPPTVPPAR